MQIGLRNCKVLANTSVDVLPYTVREFELKRKASSSVRCALEGSIGL